MPAPLAIEPVEPWHLDAAEDLAFAYHRAAKGDAWTALVALARAALEERADADAARTERDRHVSRGYVRASARVGT